MKNDLSAILEKVCALSGISLRKNETEEQAILRGLDVIEKKAGEEQAMMQSCETRVNSILNVLMSFAQLDYSRKTEISNNLDYIDALAAGINMLGEELKGSTVSLHEKEVLLKEIHHRVKNNLQVISSLLNLQADQIDDISFKEKYRVSRDRIRSMALVHEKLYESENLSMIDFGDYVNSLANSLNLSYNPDNSRINMKIEAGKDAGMFRIETAIPCGLILNEMLSNCFKYAFPGELKGEVDVFFGKIGKKGEKPLYMLEVKDNGVGLPGNITISNAETLGFQLIAMLADQINGNLVVEQEKGTRFALTFTEQ